MKMEAKRPLATLLFKLYRKMAGSDCNYLALFAHDHRHPSSLWPRRKPGSVSHAKVGHAVTPPTTASLLSCKPQFEDQTEVESSPYHSSHRAATASLAFFHEVVVLCCSTFSCV
uniref:Uncharacterized protein n=1 Tax=Lutzomyia longipalpis TaxID=7200 RepID=A0A1B0GKV3_LUTLO